MVSITWGHSKDHRPDLKQLLYILTVSRDGAIPIHYRAAYVADCKLGTSENMKYIHRNGGRFITVLPRTRREDTALRQRLARGEVAWRHIMDKVDDEGQLIDRFSSLREPALSQEGFRIGWFHSTRKAELDTVALAGRINRATAELTQLQERL